MEEEKETRHIPKLDFIYLSHCLTETWSRLPLIIAFSNAGVWEANLNAVVRYSPNEDAVVIVFSGETHHMKLYGTKELGYVYVAMYDNETLEVIENRALIGIDESTGEYEKYTNYADEDNIVSYMARCCGGLEEHYLLEKEEDEDNE